MSQGNAFSSGEAAAPSPTSIIHTVETVSHVQDRCGVWYVLPGPSPPWTHTNCRLALSRSVVTPDESRIMTRVRVTESTLSVSCPRAPDWKAFPLTLQTALSHSIIPCWYFPSHQSLQPPCFPQST